MAQMMGKGPLLAANPANSESHREDIDIEATTASEPDLEATSKSAGRSQPPVTRTQVAKALLPAAILIVIVFWANLSHIYGLLYNQGKWTKRGHVALVDFDGGAFGQALRQVASNVNQTYGYPTYTIIDASSTSPNDVRHQVFTGQYWGAVYAFPGATSRWQSAINGSLTGAYNPKETLAYVTMSQRYYALYEGNFYATSLSVTQGASALFSQTTAATLLSTTSTAVLASNLATSAFTIPSEPIEIFAAKYDFTDDIRALLNTLGAVMPILMQFFFIMCWNGIGNGLNLYAASKKRTHARYRLFWSIVWPITAGLCSAGWSFTFKRDYPLPARAFFALWAITALYAAISFDVLDTVATYIPIGFVPLIFLTWIIFNVAAALGDPQILNQWYRISYFFPGLHWWQTCITIYSQGGVNRLDYTLPTLFAWWLLAKVAALFAISTRVRVSRADFAINPIVKAH